MAQNRWGGTAQYFTAQEEIFVVEEFLDTWGINYTKKPEESFLAQEDAGSLFRYPADLRCVVFHGPRWRAEVLGATVALKHVKNLVNEKGLSYEEALDKARKDYEQAEEEMIKSEQEANTRFANVEIDITCSWDLIELHLKRTIVHYMRGSLPTKRLLPKNYSKTYDLASHQWRFMLRSWDYRDKDGKSYSQIADEFKDEIDGLDERTVQRWVEEIATRITGMKKTKGNVPGFLFFGRRS